MLTDHGHPPFEPFPPPPIHPPATRRRGSNPKVLEHVSSVRPEDAAGFLVGLAGDRGDRRRGRRPPDRGPGASGIEGGRAEGEEEGRSPRSSHFECRNLPRPERQEG